MDAAIRLTYKNHHMIQVLWQSHEKELSYYKFEKDIDRFHVYESRSSFSVKVQPRTQV